MMRTSFSALVLGTALLSCTPSSAHSQGDGASGSAQDGAASTPAHGGAAQGAHGSTPSGAPTRPTSGPAIEHAVTSSNAFAFDLYARRRAAAGNLAFSPASISTALAMTLRGARGETAGEMTQALRAEGAPDQIADAAGALVTSLNAPGRESTLRVKNRLFGQRGFAFERDFLDRTGAAFGAPLEPVDFMGATEAARERVNGWVASETEQHIKNVLPAGGVDVDTRLVLVNAVYFRGLWEKAFDKKLTSIEPFRTAVGAEKGVPMMHQHARFAYAAADGVRLLDLPYRGGDLSLTVLLPEQPDGLGALESSLSAERVSRWLGALSPADVDVSLPRFTIDPPESLALVDDLRGLGMKLAFDPNRADFSAMARPQTGGDKLYVKAVFHKAFVEVDEKGTEAAASTAVVMNTKSIRVPVQFRADHPFVFLLRDKKTGLILFVGRVAEPRGGAL